MHILRPFNTIFWSHYFHRKKNCTFFLWFSFLHEFASSNTGNFSSFLVMMPYFGIIWFDNIKNNRTATTLMTISVHFLPVKNQKFPSRSRWCFQSFVNHFILCRNCIGVATKIARLLLSFSKFGSPHFSWKITSWWWTL